MKEPTREQLLAKYSRKPVREFVQLDCWTSELGDTVLPGDEDGHVVMRGNVYELRQTDFPVRIQVPTYADKEEVLALLAKAYRYLAKYWEPVSSPPLPADLSGDEQDLPEELF